MNFTRLAWLLSGWLLITVAAGASTRTSAPTRPVSSVLLPAQSQRDTTITPATVQVAQPTSETAADTPVATLPKKTNLWPLWLFLGGLVVAVWLRSSAVGLVAFGVAALIHASRQSKRPKATPQPTAFQSATPTAEESKRDKRPGGAWFLLFLAISGLAYILYLAISAISNGCLICH